MDRTELLDEARWRDVLTTAIPALADDPAACAQLAFRLAGQYLPALLSARRPEDRQRVWDAFWRYMTAAPTPSKPFVVPDATADSLIAAIQEELTRLGVAAT